MPQNLRSELAPPSIRLLADAVHHVAKRENDALEEILGNSDRGSIFDVPELAFSYLVGKEMLSQSRKRLGHEASLDWAQERSLGNGGPTDLVFRADGARPLAVEFKVSGTSPAYDADIAKLARLDGETYDRVFCALVDAFSTTGERDQRIEKLGADQRVERIGKCAPLPARHAGYVSDIVCIPTLWYLCDEYA